jgi:hypothetical protein
LLSCTTIVPVESVTMISISLAGTDVLAAVGDLEPGERSDLVVVLDALDKAKAPRGSGGPSYAEYVPKPAAKTLSQLNRKSLASHGRTAHSRR